MQQIPRQLVQPKHQQQESQTYKLPLKYMKLNYKWAQVIFPLRNVHSTPKPPPSRGGWRKMSENK